MSENKNQSKYNITLPESVNANDPIEIVVREGSAAKVLDPKEQNKIEIAGTIESPFNWLEKRVSEEEQVNQKRCHVLVNRVNISIQMILDELNHYRTAITGRLQIHPVFESFGINSSKLWSPNELGQFFKMNRGFFPDRTKNMEIVSTLKNFNAKVSQSIEKSREDGGSYTDNFSAVVDSNLPKSFTLELPIFKGCKVESIEVEIYASVDGRDVSLSLISPAANGLLEEYRDKCIDEVLNNIREIAPNIAIIEQ